MYLNKVLSSVQTLLLVMGGPSVLVLGDSVSEPDMYLAALWPGQGGLAGLCLYRRGHN